MAAVSSKRHCTHAFGLQLPASPHAVRVARRVARGFAAEAGVVGGGLDDVELALAEACANAVLHGSARGARFLVTGCARGRTLCFVATDEGSAMPPSSSGLGVGHALIEAVCDDVVITRRRGGGWSVRMLFVVAARKRPM